MVTVPGETLTYSTSGQGGGTITNVGTWNAPKNILETITDLQNNGVLATPIQIIYPNTAAASGANTFQFNSGINVINVSASGTIANLAILFPTIVAAGVEQGTVLQIVFDVAVTNLYLVAATGYTFLSAATSATAHTSQSYLLVGTVWKTVTF